MPQENVEIIRRVNAAFNSGDWDGWLPLFDPGFVYYEGASYLDTPSVIRGRDQFRSAIESYGAELEGFRGDIVELINADDRVLCLTRWSGTGRSSGLRVEMLEAIVFTIRDGRIIEGRAFSDRAEALEALGLSEQDAQG